MARNTKQRILDSADALFAEQGYTQTSLRQVTSRAGVNVAAVNYHFGNKRNLIQMLFKQYLDVLMPAVTKALDSLEQAPDVGLEEMLSALVPALLLLEQVRPNGTAQFVRLLGKGYNETQGHLRRFIMTHYGEVLRRIVRLIGRSLPNISASTLFWRLHFAMGSFVFSLSSSQALMEIAHADYQQDIHIDDLMQALVPFMAKGIAAEPY